ncbi:MAG: methyl-accepting chemotaxis protein [Nitrospirae bacterium]|nr:MAG: methyl-accepting chemotaxis protein [Nitrospirota bacterium]
MMEAPLSRKRLPLWKRRFYVHKIQRTYAIWFGLFMFFSSLLVFGLAFLAPFIPPALKLVSQIPLEERARAANQFLILAQTVTVWPALAVLIPAAAVFSIYLTHRLAGPLFRLEQTARELIRGNLALRIRLRKGDELHELAGLLNEVLDKLEQAFRGIRESQTHVREVLSWIMDEMRKQPSVNREVLNRLEIALKGGERIDEILKRFQLSKPS